MSPEKSSRTACKVALNILTLCAKPDMADILPSGVCDATQRLLLASGAVSQRTIRWSGSRIMASVYKAFDWMMPGQFEAFAHRKRFFENQVRQAIAGGTTQLLLLGGGYDTMGWRLASEYPGVEFFEIDHPATAALKAKGIEEMGARDNHHLIAEDLSKHKLAHVLSAVTRWDQSRKTVILAEGLLQYLSPEAVEDLFVQCAAVAQKATMVFTYIPTGNDGRPDAGPLSGLVLWLLKRGGEPWLWSVRPEKLGSFLAERGWRHATELVDITTRQGVEFYAVAEKRVVSDV